VQVVFKTAYHVVESFGFPLPVLVTEALTFADRKLRNHTNNVTFKALHVTCILNKKLKPILKYNFDGHSIEEIILGLK
jgi:hypothetical protein